VKRLSIVAAVAVLAAAVAVYLVRWPGHLDEYGNGVGAPVQLGRPISVGLVRLENGGGGTIEIEHVQLHEQVPGLEFVGALVQPKNLYSGTRYGFPPPEATQPVAGLRIGPHRHVDVLVGLRATRVGAYRLHGFDAFYRGRGIGFLRLRHRAHVGVEVDLCAQREPVGQGAKKLCDPPDMFE
jgi:hypothetical protein